LVAIQYEGAEKLSDQQKSEFLSYKGSTISKYFPGYGTFTGKVSGGVLLIGRATAALRALCALLLLTPRPSLLQHAQPDSTSLSATTGRSGRRQRPGRHAVQNRIRGRRQGVGACSQLCV